MNTEIIAEVGYNRPEDVTNEAKRIVRLYADEGQIYLSFELGKCKDDTISLIFDSEEFFTKLIRAIEEQEAGG